MKLSEKINNVSPSSTVLLGQKARELKALGKDIIQLGEGEPDFNTPNHIIEAAFVAANCGETKYTSVAGTKKLRSSISKRFQKDHQLNFTEDQIIVGNGAKQLIFNALLVTINPGDQVIIPSPYWVSYPQMVKFADGVPIVVDCQKIKDFKISPELLEKNISQNTRWLILNSPVNPTGSVYTKDDLLELAAVIRKKPNLGIICDDIYGKIIFDDEKFFTLSQVAPDIKYRILTVNGVSKSYAMTGWRIGYAAGNKKLIDAMIKLQGQSTTNASSISQVAASAALSGNQDFINKWKKIYKKRRDLTFKKLKEDFPDFNMLPKGAFYHFINCKKFLGKSLEIGKKINNDLDFCNFLLELHGVAVVPGSEFGCDGYFRLCYAKSEEDLINACIRIKKFVSSIR